MTDSSDTSARKLEHIRIVLGKDVQFRTKTTLMECVGLAPKRGSGSGIKPDMRAKFLGKDIAAPVFVSGMTGGHPSLAKINLDIAKACSAVGIPMGVGSQRAMIEDPKVTFTFDVKKEYPDVILLGNIGASHTVMYPIDRIEDMLDKVDADALCVHTNPGQEAAQVEGNINFKGVFDAIARIADKIDRKVIVKEVGVGISKEIAERLEKTKVFGIDTGGSGGTNWIAIELYRAAGHRSVDIFREWGMPTAQSLIEVKSAFGRFVTATGGIRTGVDITKAIALGADACGIAYPVLQAQHKDGARGVEEYLRGIIDELSAEMERLGCRNLDELRGIGYLIGDPLKGIVEQRVGRGVLKRD